MSDTAPQINKSIEVMIQRKDSVATSVIGLDQVVARVNTLSNENPIESPRASDYLFAKTKINKVTPLNLQSI